MSKLDIIAKEIGKKFGESTIGYGVKKAEYDKTIQATIVRVVDQTIGKFMVKYQDSIFYAYGSPDIKYSNGTEVYILIPR